MIVDSSALLAVLFREGDADRFEEALAIIERGLRMHPKDGRFRVEVAPGAYRVRASVDDGSSCWKGEAKQVKVVAGFTQVRLHVYNACIV